MLVGRGFCELSIVLVLSALLYGEYLEADEIKAEQNSAVSVPQGPGVTSNLKPEVWSLHFQATALTQYRGDITSPYSGTNSLFAASESKTSLTSTLFLGRRLWSDGEIYINPELAAGSGLSGTHGIAGYPNGEIYRVDEPVAKVSLSRILLRQVFELGGSELKVEADKNQLEAQVSSRRIVLVGGKFSLNDYFDNNTYSHDPRTQFMNWSLMDNGAWDYAADTRGYTWGFLVEYHEPRWALRFASVMEPREANMLEFEKDVSKSHGDNLEFEYHYIVGEHPGVTRILGYWNHAHMGSYRMTLNSQMSLPDITVSRDERHKIGGGINIEQEVSPSLGSFLRLGWSDGKNETWAFTEVDQTLSLGLNLKGTSWKRSSDILGAALIINGISNDHADYLAIGGYGFIIGDGKLNYAPEEIFETFYLCQFTKTLGVTGDYQFVNHPAYNSDRGPVSVFSGRLHMEL